MTIPILLDCDPGIDDTFAILTAAHFGRLVGITTVNGNVGIEHTTHNALVATQIAALDVPVHRGAARPLIQPPLDAARIHGPTGLGDSRLPTLVREPASDDAVAFICDTARAVDGLHLIAVGPLTNVALALGRDPGLRQSLAGVTIMGGSAHVGNVTATAEFNIWADPEAAAIVFRDAAPVTMVGLDLTHQVLFDSSHVARIRDAATETASLMADFLEYYVARGRERGLAGAAIHDACAVLAVTHPELFTSESRPVEIELTGTHTRGMTVVDERPSAPGDTAADIVRSAVPGAVSELVVEAATAF